MGLYFSSVLLIMTMPAPRVAPVYALPVPPIDSLALAQSDSVYRFQSVHRSASAESLGKALLPVFESRYGAGSREVARLLDRLADALADFGPARRASDESRRLIWRAMAIREAFGDSVMLAGTLVRAARYYRDRQQIDSSLAEFHRALAIEESSLGSTDDQVALTLNSMARVQRLAGDYDGDRRSLERALAIREHALGATAPETELIRTNLALTLMDTGDYAGARPLFEHAIKTYEGLGYWYELKVAEQSHNLANLLHRTGDIHDALALLKRSLAIRERRLGPEHNEVAEALQDMSSLHLELGDTLAAQRALERALQIQQKVLTPTDPVLAINLQQIADVLTARGESDSARAFYRRSLEIHRVASGMNSPDAADALVGLAILEDREGHAEAALSGLRAALSIKRRALGADHPDAARILGQMAGLELRASDRDSAFVHALQVERTGAEHLRLTVRTLPERQAMQYAKRRPRGLDVMLSALSGANDEIRDRSTLAWDAVARSRALVLDEMAERHGRAWAEGDSAVRLLSSSVAAARRRLANLTVGGPGGIPPTEYRSMLAGVRTRCDSLELELARRSAGFREAYDRGGIGLEEIVQAIPKSAALVAYVRFDHPEVQLGGTAAAAEYMAFVCAGAATPVRVVFLGSAEAIDAQVESWRQAVSRSAVAGGGPAVLDRARAGETLRRSVWDPLAPYIGLAHRVFLVPDGSLNLVSLATLPTGEGRYVIENGPTLHYLSAECDLAIGAHPRPPATGNLLVVGGVDYDHAAAPTRTGVSSLGARRGSSDPIPSRQVFRGALSHCSDFAALRFAAIPASRSESEEVMELWRNANREREDSSGRVESLLGEGATESAFKARAPGHSALHIATHAFILDGECGGGRQIETKTDLTDPENLENPLLHSGLALAGANRRGAAHMDGDDGVLTSEEIASLDLSGTDGVVLSACETGMGALAAGEGVFGLRRAFTIAGAGGLVLSLWKIEDSDARRWMHAFYRARLERRLEVPEAAREASLELLRSMRNRDEDPVPSAWGGFVATGRWK